MDVNKVTVLLANHPRMLRESLESLLERQPDIEVVSLEPDPIELLAAVEHADADVVVISLPDAGEDPGICSHLFAEYPELLIVAVSPETPEAYVYRQIVTKERLEPLSDGGLLAAIRSRIDPRPRQVNEVLQ